MKRNLVKIVTLCMAVALCLSAMLCFSLTASAATTTLYDADVDATVVVKNNGGFLRVADADNAIKNDIATNGAATYYTIEVTATANVENYVYPILFNESPYNEAWPSKNYESNYKTSTTGSFVLFGSIELGSNKATNIWFYLEDTATEVTLTVSHVKVTVTRDADPETSEASEASEASDVEVSETSETSDVEISDVETSEASDVEASEASDVEASEVSETSETSETSEPAEFKHGDATGDNEIDMKDVLAIRKFIAGMESEINEAAADAYRDGVIDMKDVLVIRKFIANMITELPVYPEATSEEPSEAASEEPSEIASEEPSEAASEEPSEEASEVSEDLK